MSRDGDRGGRRNFVRTARGCWLASQRSPLPLGEPLKRISVRGQQHAMPEMTLEALVDLLRLFESAGIEVWLDGGWAVDAVLGVQTRPHKDVDIILRVADLPKLRERLAQRGFEIRIGGTESNFVLADRSGLEVDVHAIVFDRDGN